jgi:predicted RNase H-like nuclease (RuvC/YqgF family)
VQGLQQQQQAAANLPLSSAAALSSASVPVVALMPHLQNALHLGIMQQEALMHILSGISLSDATNSQRLYNASKNSRSSSFSACTDYSTEVLTDRERDLTQQVAELQGRVAILTDELQTVKLKNVGLERKLNAIYNKEEEERIRKEEAAKEDG